VHSGAVDIVMMKIRVLRRIGSRLDWYIGTNVSVELAASILRVVPD
jgi:hypothetical protein